MTVQTEQVLKEALDLSPTERVELVEGILSSFTFPFREECDAVWAKEVEDRIAAHDRGEIRAVPASVVFERIEKKYSGVAAT